MFGLRPKPAAADSIGLKQQVAAWADRLPPALPIWLRTGLVVAAMLLGGTAVVCLTPAILFTLVYTATLLTHRH